MEASVVQLSDFAVAGKRLSRIDAEFMSPSLARWERGAVIHQGSRLEALSAKYEGPVINDELSLVDALVGYIAIDNVDVSDGLVIPSVLRFEDRPSRAKFIVETGDILVSNVRPNRGGVALVTKRVAGSLASSGFTLIRPITALTQEFSAEFLFAFLKSRFGRDQLVRRNRGSMYPAVTKEDVRDIWIPTPPKTLRMEVEKCVISGLAHHDRFFELNEKQRSKLKLYLSKLIGEPPPSPLSRNNNVECTSVCMLSGLLGLKSAQRIDAEFFRPEYQAVDERISSLGEQFLMGEYYKCFAGRSQGKHISEIFYLRQSVLTNYGVNWSAAEVEMGNPEPANARVRQGDILMACTAHEVYYVARKNDYVRKIPEEALDTNVCVADIMVIRPKSKKAGGVLGTYVSAFLRSDWGLHQVQRCIRGLRGGHVYGFDIEKYVRVPMPDTKWLAAFESISVEAEDCRNQGRGLIEKAVQKVEAWAEKLPFTSKKTAV